MSTSPSTLRFVIPDTIADWPWPRRINPHFEEVQAESESWFRSFNAFSPKALQAFERCKFCLLAAVAYPDMPRTHFRTACDLMLFFFTIDEYTDVLAAPKVREYVEIVMDALRNPHKPRPACEVVLGEIARQYWALGVQSATPKAQTHFIQAFEKYLYSVVEQANDRDNHRIRGVDEYMELRRLTIGVQPSYPMNELGMDLVDEAYNHPIIDELRILVVEMVIYDNDICSYKKEYAAGDDEHNIVSILMHEQNLDISGAMEWVQARRREIQVRFLALYKQVPSFGPEHDPQVQEYVQGIANWARGNNTWSFESGRYFGSEGVEIQKHRVVLIPIKDIGK